MLIDVGGAGNSPDDADALKYGAMLGIGGLGKGLKSGASSFAKGLDYAFGALSTRLGNISEPLRLRARDYERKVMERTEQTLTTGVLLENITSVMPINKMTDGKFLLTLGVHQHLRHSKLFLTR